MTNNKQPSQDFVFREYEWDRLALDQVAMDWYHGDGIRQMVGVALWRIRQAREQALLNKLQKLSGRDDLILD